MNELKDRLQAFDEALSGFQQVLRTALSEQNVAKDRIATQWDDDFGVAFLARYAAINDAALAAHADISERLQPDVEGRIGIILRYLQ